jgi:hypothetical protein
MPKKIEPAVRERVMRMIAEHRSQYARRTELARVLAARERLGVETVRRWIVTIIGLFKTECIRTAVFHGDPSLTSNTPPPTGSTGTTTAGSTDHLGCSP